MPKREHEWIDPEEWRAWREALRSGDEVYVCEVRTGKEIGLVRVMGCDAEGVQVSGSGERYSRATGHRFTTGRYQSTDAIFPVPAEFRTPADLRRILGNLLREGDGLDRLTQDQLEAIARIIRIDVS
jgi:hypothetical protein